MQLILQFQATNILVLQPLLPLTRLSCNSVRLHGPSIVTALKVMAVHFRVCKPVFIGAGVPWSMVISLRTVVNRVDVDVNVESHQLERIHP